MSYTLDGMRSFAVVVALLASTARAEVTLTVPRSPAELFTLKNGLKVVLEPMPGHPLVAAVVAYAAGWAHDPPGHAGLAHLVEHLTYRGSRHLPGRGIFEQLEAAGSTRWNGTTGQDLATYYAVVPAEHFALPLWIESERMAFTLESFSEKSLALEQQRVRKELLQRRRTAPTFDLFINQALYPEGHPYRLTSDEIDDVLATKLSEASWFFQTHYRPDNAYLILVGGFPPRAPSVVRRYFSSIVNPPGASPRLPPYRRAFTARETLEVAQPVFIDNRLVMVFPAPADASDDAPAFSLAAALLDGSGPWSLEAALVKESLLAEWVELDIDPAALGSTVRISAQVRHGVAIEQAERAIEAHLDTFARFDDERALSEMRTALAISSIARHSDPLESAMAHLSELRGRGAPFDLALDLVRKRRVTARDIAGVTARFLDRRRRLSARLVEGSSACHDGCVSYTVESE